MSSQKTYSGRPSVLPMREADETTRERIREALREEPATPSELAARFDLTPSVALSHIEHVARSAEGDGETVMVAPPACTDCGFDGFDDLLNRPSRCPDCRSEAVAEPRVAIEAE